jgi:hypothetical protein
MKLRERAVCPESVCRVGLTHVGVPAGPRLALVILAGIASYALATIWRNPGLITEIKNFRSRRRRAEPGLATAN